MILLRMATERARGRETRLPDAAWAALVDEAARVLVSTRLTLEELAALEVVERDALEEAARRLESERALLHGAAVTQPHLVSATLDGGEAHDEAALRAAVEEAAQRIAHRGV